MKPSDFKLNSDYLSIAQVNSKTYNVVVGAGTLAVDGYSSQNFDFTTPAQIGAVDRILINKDGGSFRVCSSMTFYPSWTSDKSNRVRGDIFVFRTSKTNLRVKVVLDNYGEGVSTYPNMTFQIKVSSFNSPNVF